MLSSLPTTVAALLTVFASPDAAGGDLATVEAFRQAFVSKPSVPVLYPCPLKWHRALYQVVGQCLPVAQVAAGCSEAERAELEQALGGLSGDWIWDADYQAWVLRAPAGRWRRLTH